MCHAIPGHSVIRMAKLAEPLIKEGGCLLTVAFYGAERVVEHENLMEPVKAALKSAVRYMAAELGPKGYPGSRHLARATQDPSGIGHQGVR
jgi:enoyl-[acyl-carrier-protein] reductase (NADH)